MKGNIKHMTSEELHDFIAESVDAVLLDSKNLIANNILSGANQSDSKDKFYSLMVLNAIDIATHISVQSVVTTLEKLGLIVPSDYEKLPGQPPLKLVWDSSKHQHQDN
jgi:hypothetical protein